MTPLPHHPSMRQHLDNLTRAQQAVIAAARAETHAENAQTQRLRALTARRHTPRLADHDQGLQQLQAAKNARRTAVAELETIEAETQRDGA